MLAKAMIISLSFIARQKRIADYKQNIAIKIADPSNQQIQDIL